jgi:mycothiol synthase
MSLSDVSARMLVAAAVVRAGPRVMTLVHPAVRAHGVEEQLLDWAHGQAPDATVETESLTDARSRLFASRGLTQVFAEDVMRISLAEPVPAPVWPDGITLTNWSGDVAARFHAVWETAFRERPGFSGTPAEEWIVDVSEEEAFRPAWSVLATHDRLGDVGFVVGTVGWIDQVGVAPAARGGGLGAALVRESLSRMRTDGASEAWLNVNVDNPARLLYERLGFRIKGRRARFQPGPPAAGPGSSAAGPGSAAAGPGSSAAGPGSAAAGPGSAAG